MKFGADTIMLIKACLSTLLLLAVTVSADPKPCCGPKQYMAVVGGTMALADPRTGPTGYTFYQNGAFDFQNRKIGLYMDMNYGNGTNNAFRVIQFYDQGYQWVILDDVKYCTKQPMSWELADVCIPDNATYTGALTIGGTSAGMMVDTWMMSGQSSTMIGTATMNVASGCIPVGTSFQGGFFDGSTLISVLLGQGIYNISLGIPDPDKWFTVPSYCNAQDNHILPDRHQWIHGLADQLKYHF